MASILSLVVLRSYQEMSHKEHAHHNDTYTGAFHARTINSVLVTNCG